MLQSLLPNFVLSLAAVILVIAALSDAARFRIPNWSVALILILFPFYAITVQPPLPWLQHLETFAVIFVIGYLMWLKKWAGAGDIKLIAAIALWAGPHYWPQFLFVTTAAGGILSLGIGAVTLFKKRYAANGSEISLSKTPIPYGVAIAMGGLCALALLSHPDLLTLQIQGD